MTDLAATTSATMSSVFLSTTLLPSTKALINTISLFDRGRARIPDISVQGNTRCRTDQRNCNILSVVCLPQSHLLSRFRLMCCDVSELISSCTHPREVPWTTRLSEGVAAGGQTWGQKFLIHFAEARFNVSPSSEVSLANLLRGRTQSAALHRSSF